MSSAIDTKKVVVEEIASKLKESKSTIIVDYRGLNVSEVTELRKQLREANVEFKVYKNTMTRRAVEQAELDGLNDVLTDRMRSHSVLKMLSLRQKFLTSSRRITKLWKSKRALSKEKYLLLKK